MANINDWGVTEKGFYRPTLEEIITEKNNKAKLIFGEDFDTGELTPQGKFFRICAAAESKLCEIGENIYYSISPSTARGISLDRVCEFANLTRESAGYAVHILRVYGKLDYTVPAGTLFKNSAGVEFYCTQDAVINGAEMTEDTDEDGNPVYIYYADVTVQCRQSGEVGNVTNINATSEVNQNINGVTYYDTLAYGTEIESDPDLRDKFNKVVQGLGTNTSASIKSNVLRINGVNDVIVVDNTTAENIKVSDSLTVISGSYAVIVHSDDTTIDDEIGAAIFEKHPLGVIQSGLKSVDVTDESGIVHTMKFSYVESTAVQVSVKCKVNRDFPDDGTIQIENNIISYINGLGINENVVYSRLYDYIYNVHGVHEVTELKVNNDTKTLEVGKLEIAKADGITVDFEVI